MPPRAVRKAKTAAKAAEVADSKANGDSIAGASEVTKRRISARTRAAKAAADQPQALSTGKEKTLQQSSSTRTLTSRTRTTSDAINLDSDVDGASEISPPSEYDDHSTTMLKYRPAPLPLRQQTYTPAISGFERSLPDGRTGSQQQQWASAGDELKDAPPAWAPSSSSIGDWDSEYDPAEDSDFDWAAVPRRSEVYVQRPYTDAELTELNADIELKKAVAEAMTIADRRQRANAEHQRQAQSEIELERLIDKLQRDRAKTKMREREAKERWTTARSVAVAAASDALADSEVDEDDCGYNTGPVRRLTRDDDLQSWVHRRQREGRLRKMVVSGKKAETGCPLRRIRNVGRWLEAEDVGDRRLKNGIRRRRYCGFYSLLGLVTVFSAILYAYLTQARSKTTPRS